MRPPRSRTSLLSSLSASTRRRNLKIILVLTSVITAVVIAHTSLLLDEEDEEEPQPRAKLTRRERRSWAAYIEPIIAGGTFWKHFGVHHDDFMTLVEMLRPTLGREERMGAKRNGAVPVEFQVAMTLRHLAGGAIVEVMKCHGVAKSTAYAVLRRVLDALNQYQCHRGLDCRSAEEGTKEDEAAKEQANLFQTLPSSTNHDDRSSVIINGHDLRRAAGEEVIDRLFVRFPQLSTRSNARSSNISRPSSNSSSCSEYEEVGHRVDKQQGRN